MLTRLKELLAGEHLSAFLVGGYLRDSLRSGSPERDIDIAVAGDSQTIGRELARQLGGTFVPLNPALGKARVVVPASDADPIPDFAAGAVSNPESGTESGQWTIDLSGFSGTIEEDLAQRDFTINAMALPLEHWGQVKHWGQVEAWDRASLDESVIDPFQGRSDLAQKCIRSLNPHVFRDDPGRLLRAVRLAAGLGFRLVPETARQVLADASQVNRIAPKRLRDEFMAILTLDGAKGSLEALDRLDLLCRVIPELEHTKGVDQPKVHYWDVWGHILHTVENAERITKGHQHSPIFTLIYWTAETDTYFSQPVGDGYSRRTMLKLGALFHDIAKPQTKQKDETGRTRFPGHSELGAEVTTERLRQLRFESKSISMVAKMVEHHLRPAHMMQGVEVPTGRAIHRYFRDVGDVAVDTLYLCQADFLAAKGPELNPDDWADHARMIAHVVHTGFHPASSGVILRLINGKELMQHFTLDAGPMIGRLLECIDEARAAGEISNREEALALASQSLARYQEET